MKIEELEGEALKLDPKSRARLAGRLLDSLDELSEDENAQLWAEETQRRDAQMDAHPDSGRPAAQYYDSESSGLGAAFSLRRAVLPQTLGNSRARGDEPEMTSDVLGGT
jgi:hypothetical protein